MEHKCKCKKGGRGHNFIPDRITLTDDIGSEISNRDLVCHHCTYKKRGDTLSCLRFDKKPDYVLEGKECEAFLSSGHDLGKSGHDCGDCGSCGECNDCGNCGGCGDCK